MRDEAVFLILLILSLCGIILLAHSVKAKSPKIVGIGDVEKNMVGEFVRISGRIESIRENNGNVFIKLCEGECANVVIFKHTAENSITNPYLLRKGDNITVEGIVEEYKGTLEVVANGYYAVSRG
ncbi:MAG: OB-fold nucleic acid binding domain-containing protein [Candidatus Micrarchaeia archaeon]